MRNKIRQLTEDFVQFIKAPAQDINLDRICQNFNTGSEIGDAICVATFLDWKELIKKLFDYAAKSGIDIPALKQAIKQTLSDSPYLEDLLNTEVIPALNESLDSGKPGEAEDDLEEDIETHETLNPLLFDEDESLNPEVREKLMAVVDQYVKNLKENNIPIYINDIVLSGSNANYNYTKDSDIDVHIIAEVKKDELLWNMLYNAVRSLFGKKFDIKIYGIPVELYVETGRDRGVSNGIYSIKNDMWITKPEYKEIPELDEEAFNELYDEWEEKCNKILDSKEPTERKISGLIDRIYALRTQGLKTDGEFSLQNLVFKELRNNRILDELKDLRDQVISQRLSLEKGDE